MLTDLDYAVDKRVHGRLEDGLGRFRTKIHSEHLVKVAVEETAIPANREGGATHQAIDSRRIKSVDELLHVWLEIL